MDAETTYLDFYNTKHANMIKWLSEIETKDSDVQRAIVEITSLGSVEFLQAVINYAAPLAALIMLPNEDQAFNQTMKAADKVMAVKLNGKQVKDLDVSKDELRKAFRYCRCFIQIVHGLNTPE